MQNCLDLGTETDATRDLYGRDHRGCCYLLGRKLIEAGVRFVTVTVIQPPEHVGRPGYGRPNGVFLNWDHHEGIYKNGPCGGPQGSMKPGTLRPAPSHHDAEPRSFVERLDRGPDSSADCSTRPWFVLSPRWAVHRTSTNGAAATTGAVAMSIAMAGAGVPGGQVIGATDKDGGEVVDRRYTPYDYAETIYTKLGIDTKSRLRKPDGRPVDFTDGGRPIKEV